MSLSGEERSALSDRTSACREESPCLIRARGTPAGQAHLHYRRLGDRVRDSRDPRLTGVTITDAKGPPATCTTPTLYYTVFGSSLEDEPGLRRCGGGAGKGEGRGCVRKWAPPLGVRFTPTPGVSNATNRSRHRTPDGGSAWLGPRARR